MGGFFPTPSKPRLPKVEEVKKTVIEDEEEVKRRQRKKLQSLGREQNLLSGIQTVLKQRLGE